MDENGDDIGVNRVLLIIWHSRTGAARAMAEAAADGAASEAGAAGAAGAVVKVLAAELADAADVLAAAAYLFVCPENLGSMSGEMKAFFDRTYYPVLGRIEGRAYATAVAAGNAGAGAEAAIDRIATGWRLRRVAGSLIIRTGAQTPAEIAASKTVSRNELQTCRDMGRALAAGLQLGIF